MALLKMNHCKKLKTPKSCNKTILISKVLLNQTYAKHVIAKQTKSTVEIIKV